MPQSSNTQSTSKLPRTTTGILKKGKSTPNIFVTSTQPPSSPKEFPDPPNKRVKFTYISPCDRWRTQKQFGIRSQSIESFATFTTVSEASPTAPAPRVGRSVDRKLAHGVTGRSLSRTQRLLHEQNNADQQEDDTTKILSFLVTHVFLAFQRHYTLADLLRLTILQYLIIVHDIVKTFDKDILRRFPITSTTIHKLTGQYKTFAMGVAEKYQIKLSQDVLTSPMTQRPNCLPTKRKLSFLRTLVEYAEETMLKEKIEEDRRRRAAIEAASRPADAIQPLPVAIEV